METEKLEQAAGRAARGEAAIEEVPSVAALAYSLSTQYPAVLCVLPMGGDAWVVIVSRALRARGAGR